jgi:hypothetical protein
VADSVATQLDRPYAQQPETRAAAVARVSREEQADMLLDMLGLVDQACPLVIDGRHCCPSCRKPLPDPISNGGRKPCRRRACVEAADGGAR